MLTPPNFFSKNWPLTDSFIGSQCVSTSLGRLVRFLVIFFEASHCPSGHMISSRPSLVNPPSVPNLAPPPPKKSAPWRRRRRGGIKKMLKSFFAAVLLYASVKRFFVSRMRDFSVWRYSWVFRVHPLSRSMNL